MDLQDKVRQYHAHEEMLLQAQAANAHLKALPGPGSNISDKDGHSAAGSQQNL